MGKVYTDINEKLKNWISKQNIFFVATAPLNRNFHINCSPKGMDSFRILNPLEVAYVDLTGSGAETIAHIKENSRIVIMFCAFEGPPKIVRLHGKGSVITNPDTKIKNHFPSYHGIRSFIKISITRVSDSCGYSIPYFDYKKERTTLLDWAQKKGKTEITKYQKEKNIKSIDGLKAL